MRQEPAPQARGYNPAMPPVIALLTDFGLQDPYVGAMKGAILSVCPEATLVDVLHEVPAHDVAAGALALEAAYRHFPGGTVFVAVVDPGVGSPRRPIAVGAGRWLFVGPDNGLFTPVLDAHPSARVHLVANPLLFREPLSPVFHGRDLFGPVAGHLARGLSLDEVGPRVADAVRLAAAAEDAARGRLAGGGRPRRPLRQPHDQPARVRPRAARRPRPRGARGEPRRAAPAPRALVLGRGGRASPARSSARAAGSRSPSTAAAPTRCRAPAPARACWCAGAPERATLAAALSCGKRAACRSSEAARHPERGTTRMAEEFEDPHDEDVFAPVGVQAFKHVPVDTAQGITRITLNRPPANVLSVEMMQELATAVESLEYQRDVKLVTLFGSGKYFSAGFELGDHLGDRAYMMLEGFRRVFEALAKVDKPTLAVVAGPALGAGCILAAGCDMVLAAQSAKLGHPEIRGGVFNTVAAALLPRLVGRRRAFELLMTGTSLSAADAERIGLVTRVVPDERLDAEVAADRPALPGVERAGDAADAARDRGRPGPPLRRGGAPRRGRVPEPAAQHRGRRGGAARGVGEAQARLEGPVSAAGRPSHGDWDSVLEARQVYEAELAAGRLREAGIEARVIDQSYRQEPVPSVRVVLDRAGAGAGRARRGGARDPGARGRSRPRDDESEET